MEVARIAKPMFGDKPYQLCARKALPILVRQAQLGEKIYYSDLADELGMTNPRNLDYVLGSVGVTLENLKKESGKDIPAIQTLVVSIKDELPGQGIGEFFETSDYRKLTRAKKRKLVDGVISDVFAYQKWEFVINNLGLELDIRKFTKLTEKAARKRSRFGGGGESPAHKLLKQYVAAHPALVGLKGKKVTVEIEHSLPSGDKVDVFFQHQKEEVAVEVKSALSDDVDIVRGIYQCIKYQAVLQARQSANLIQGNCRSVLVLESDLPINLVPLKNMLGVSVLSGVEPE